MTRLWQSKWLRLALQLNTLFPADSMTPLWRRYDIMYYHTPSWDSWVLHGFRAFSYWDSSLMGAMQSGRCAARMLCRVARALHSWGTVLQCIKNSWVSTVQGLRASGRQQAGPAPLGLPGVGRARAGLCASALLHASMPETKTVQRFWDLSIHATLEPFSVSALTVAGALCCWGIKLTVNELKFISVYCSAELGLRRSAPVSLCYYHLDLFVHLPLDGFVLNND